MNKIKNILLIVTFGVIIFNPLLVYAQPATSTATTPTGLPEYNGVDSSISDYLCTPSGDGKDLERCINRLYRFGITAGAIVLVAMVVFAGYLYITSGEAGKGKAKSMLMNSLVGMAMLLGSYALLYFINPSLVAFRPIQPPIFESKDLPSCAAVGFGEECILPTGQKTINTTNATTADKVDQLLMLGFPGTSVSAGSDIENLLKNSNIGGVILFSGPRMKNISSKDQITSLTNSLQSIAKTPLLIAIDEEGGKVSRLRNVSGFTHLPSATELGKGDVSRVKQLNSTLSKELRSVGINVNFAPVVDLTSKNSGSVLTAEQRTFSSDPAKVSSYAAAVIDGMKSGSVIAAIKHFPGLGEATINTHTGVARVTVHDARALEPYSSLSGMAPAVMVSHLIDTTVDSKLPASISPAHYKVLKNNIGFGGVVFTDDLDMGGIRQLTGSVGDTAVAAIKAGADMLIFSNNISGYNKNLINEVRAAINKAIKDGVISQAQIDSSFSKIISLKSSYNISKK